MYKTISIFFLAALMLGLAAVASAGDGPTDAAMWLKFDEASGTLAADTTVNGNNGTLVAPAVFDPDTDTSRIYDTGASSVYFPVGPNDPGGDGTYEAVVVPHSTTLNAGLGAVSVCFFLKAFTPFNQTMRTEANFIQKGTTGTEGGASVGKRYQMYYKNDQLNWVVDDGDVLNNKAQYQSVSNPGIVTDGWVHVAGTIDMVAKQSRLYLNGNAITASQLGTWPTESIDEATPMYIGNRSDLDGSGNWPCSFRGYMDDVRVYTRVLTQNEIQDISEGLPTPTPTPTNTPTPAPCASSHWEIFD